MSMRNPVHHGQNPVHGSFGVMNLPADVIYLEVLYYLTYRDQLSFVLSSSTLFTLLIQRFKLNLIISDNPWRIDSDFTINCAHLDTTANVFHQFISNDFILKIKNLELTYDSNAGDLEDIVQWIDDNPLMGLKKLKLNYFPPIWLPDMPMLESLTLSRAWWL
eukprot:gene3293-3510_t